MRGLSMVNSYLTLLLVYECVRCNFSILGLIPLLVVNAVLSFVLAAHINSRRKHCTVPVEAELVQSERREALRPPHRPVAMIHWTHDVWRYRWGDDVCFAEDTIPPLMSLFGPLVGIRRSGTIWVDPYRSPYATYGGVLSPDWRYHLRFYYATAVLCLLCAVALCMVALAGSALR
ncbi:hypothetical protein ADJ70_08020 [Olsenella sp. oral taxon 807]|uniref:hypothetical protein n=1 Tax=Olsenella sp. oral taxon 807 TaxID=712411 RepID=UPI00067A32FE|nr:hypothetical protein [Olsenella sp. oral taxon 807]AKT48899.1 hypothetical protein ADJ70_08020 [Olsenella sp. oral taxon 807]